MFHETPFHGNGCFITHKIIEYRNYSVGVVLLSGKRIRTRFLVVVIDFIRGSHIFVFNLFFQTRSIELIPSIAGGCPPGVSNIPISKFIWELLSVKDEVDI